MKDRIRINELKNEIEIDLLKKFGDRKLICYGASSTWEGFNWLFDIWDLVEFFVDKDESRWGELYYEKEVKSPEELKKYSSEKYAVVVLAGAFEEISKVLDDMGWVRDKDYFFIYQYFYMDDQRAMCNPINSFFGFLETVPPELRHIPVTKKDTKIGIVLSIEGHNVGGTYVPYIVSLFLILKWRGYDAKLIVERLHWDGDFILYEGHLAFCDKIRNILVRKLEKIVSKDDILFIDDAEGCLSEVDANECKRVAEYSARWWKWFNVYNARYSSLNVIMAKYEKLFCHNFYAIDKFFESNHFDVINAMTALHSLGGLYHYAGAKRGIRVSSQDGMKGKTLISAYGPASYHRDIFYLLQDEWRETIEREDIYDKAEEIWKKRRGFTTSIQDESLEEYKKRSGKELGCTNYQTAIELNVEQKYDVIIPLNLSYDGAMLGIQTIFGDIFTWLEETIDYVINTLKSNVLIREHPVGKVLPEHYRRSELYTIYPEFIERYEGNKSFRYVKSNENLNIYQYIEHCKVVIPWTSTTGIEAGIMKKNVLIHTDVYYENADFVLRVDTKEEYFNALRKSVLEEEKFVENEQAAYLESLKYFYYIMHSELKTDFTLLNIGFGDWKFKNFKELIAAEGVEEIIQIIAEGVPGPYLIEQKYRRDNKAEV